MAVLPDGKTTCPKRRISSDLGDSLLPPPIWEAIVHSGEDPWSEDPARELNNQISELQARVAFPQHWSSGEHEQHIEKLRQLNFQKRLLIDYGQK